MTSLWDLDSPSISGDDVTDQLMEEHADKFRDRFEENHQKDIPTHPYKVYRDIVENNADLTTDERVVLRHLKDKYAEKWKEKKEREVNQ